MVILVTTKVAEGSSNEEKAAVIGDNTHIAFMQIITLIAPDNLKELTAKTKKSPENPFFY